MIILEQARVPLVCVWSQDALRVLRCLAQAKMFHVLLADQFSIVKLAKDGTNWSSTEVQCRTWGVV